MLEILVIIWVVRKFKEMAQDKGYVRWQWGLIGALSYYLPIVLNSIVVAPLLVASGIIESDEFFKLKIILMNLVVGISCCLITYQILRNRPDKNVSDPSLLDN
jgi:hypothetical protein